MDEISLCRLCLANSQTVQILVADELIEFVLKKHNISFEKQNHNGIDGSNIIRHICETCWGKVAAFDEFFVHVEGIHQMYMTNELKRVEEMVEEKIDINEQKISVINLVEAAVLPGIHEIDADIKSEGDDEKPVEVTVDKIVTRSGRKYSISESDESSGEWRGLSHSVFKFDGFFINL